MDARTSQKNSISYLVLSLFSVILIAVGFALAPSLKDLLSGYYKIIIHHSLIDTDAFSIAENLGTPFVNSGLLLCLVLVTYRLSKTRIEGGQIVAAIMVMGFAFYGKTPFTVLPLVLGVYLYSLSHKIPFSGLSALAWLSTALSGLVGVLAFGTHNLQIASPVAILTAIVIGTTAGYLFAYTEQHISKLHKNFTLLRSGLAAGLIGIFFNLLLRVLNLGHETYRSGNHISGENLTLSAVMYSMFLLLIAIGFILEGGKMERLEKLLFRRHKTGNFVVQYGLGPALVNMGLLGSLALTYILMVGGQINGPMFACIWTMAALGAYGLTISNVIPVMLGVVFVAFVSGGLNALGNNTGFLEGAFNKLSSRGMLLTGIFCCGLAPVTGVYGRIAGFIAGMVHCMVAPNVSILHSQMVLYNNGLATGLVAIFLIPLLDKCKKREIRIHMDDPVGLDLW